jgi:hypothetical protein
MSVMSSRPVLQPLFNRKPLCNEVDAFLPAEWLWLHPESTEQTATPCMLFN